MFWSGKGVHYKAQAGGWVSVSACGVATQAQLKSKPLTDIGEGCRRSNIIKHKANETNEPRKSYLTVKISNNSSIWHFFDTPGKIQYRESSSGTNSLTCHAGDMQRGCQTPPYTVYPVKGR